MTTPRQRYNEKLQAIQGHISEIEQENRVNMQRIGELESAYEQHVNAFELDQADAATVEIEQLRRSVEIRKQQLATLKSADYPARKQAAAQYLADLDEQAEQVKADYLPLHQEILKAKEEYLQKAAEAVAVHNRYFEVAREKHMLQDPRGLMIQPHGLAGGIADYEVREGQIRGAAAQPMHR